MKMIENNLPIKFISRISRKEANRKKPIYGIHKWFGRKTDAIFRSLLLSLKLDASKKEVFDSIYYSNNEEMLKGKVILDPFMGGGVTLINTIRLGGKAIGIDVNPVAWFITKSELQVPIKEHKTLTEEELINELEREFYNLQKNIGKEMQEAYTTYIYDETKKERKKVDIMYVFWVKEAVCPKCRKKSKLFHNYIITKLKKKNFQNYNICPCCNEIVRGNDDILECYECGYKFNKSKGIYKGGSFVCESCGEYCNLIRDIMKKKKGRLSDSMYAIEYYDVETGKKGFKIPDKWDIENYNKIKEKLRDLKNIPTSEIPNGYNTKQLKNYNYKYWKQMFNHRQLYYLSRLIEEISKIEDNNIKELFLCVFSNTINANNMFCIYNSQYGKIEPLFGDHHMAPVMNPIENNLWGAKLGRGSFKKYFKALIESKKFNMRPYERVNINGKNNNIILHKEKFYSKCANTFEELLDCDKNVMMKCTTGENLSFIPSNSVDAVVTDPPYYLAINYSEISEFFYVWERVILKSNYSFFKNKHISYENEVTVNESKGISKEEFVIRLSRCFSELKRVLKDEAPLVLTYNSSSPSGWELLFIALLKAGFYIKKVYPVHTELRAGLIDNRRCKMNYDLIIVAKTSIEVKSDDVSVDVFMKYLEFEFEKTYDELNDNELSLQDSLLIRAGKAFELYSTYPNIFEKEERVDIKYILEKIYLLKDI